MARLARLTAQQDDGYAEAYPSTFEGLSFAAIDDDDDEGDDLMKIDTRQNFKRHEFETDEAWLAHQSQREATPKVRLFLLLLWIFVPCSSFCFFVSLLVQGEWPSCFLLFVSAPPLHLVLSSQLARSGCVPVWCEKERWT